MTDGIRAGRMRQKQLWMVLVFAALSCGSFVRAQAATQTAATPTAQSGAGLDAAEERKIAEMVAASGAPSVSVAVVENGKLTYAKAFGKASLAGASGGYEYALCGRLDQQAVYGGGDSARCGARQALP